MDSFYLLLSLPTTPISLLITRIVLLTTRIVLPTAHTVLICHPLIHIVLIRPIEEGHTLVDTSDLVLVTVVLIKGKNREINR